MLKENLKAKAIALNIDNIDTDQIIPARFLKETSRKGFGEKLFYDWRYDKDGAVKPDFPLNRNSNQAKILVASRNFGCGSSREHAAWAIAGAGFEAVIASSFADIFRNNALNNFVLPIELDDNSLKRIHHALEINPDLEFEIDYGHCTLKIDDLRMERQFFIDPDKMNSFIHSYDDIDYLISKRDKIAEYESKHSPTSR